MVMEKMRAAAAKLVGGGSVSKQDLKEGQTAHSWSLQREFALHPSRGLTPSKLAAILDEAETGHIISQYELFEDMEEKDGHVYAEMAKRRRAVAGLDWYLTPPPNPSKREKDNTQALTELMQGLDDFEDVLFDVTDAFGKGFANLEFNGWSKNGGDWLPNSITHRPQSWFQLERGIRQEIRLRGPVNGEPLQPFGWITHIHRAKSGYLERSALFRVLVWPYLFKNYSVGDLAEFLEVYGIPMRVGKYPSGATKSEKRTLMRALVQLGHNAAGIIPQGMDLEFLRAAEGDPKAFELMIDWCEKTQSKAILGGTLTSQADGKTSTNALGNVHNDVRLDLRDSDARQVAKTLSRDLIYPMAVLNGLTEDWSRCPRLIFNTKKTRDLQEFAKAIPPMLRSGMKVGRQWAQEEFGIPEPDDAEDLLTLERAQPRREAPATAAANAKRPEETPAPDTAPDAMRQQLAERLGPTTQAWGDRLAALLDEADSLEDLEERLLALAPELSLDDYTRVMAQGLETAHLAGRNDVQDEIDQRKRKRGE